MPRQISRRYLLFYLSVSAILLCGSSRRIPREASCPSCSQDCPEALTVQLPWSSYQESNQQDFSVNQLRNSPNSRLIHRRIYHDLAHNDNIPMRQNPTLFGNYIRFPQQQGNNPYENVVFHKYFINYLKSLDKPETFFQNKSGKKYPFIVPAKQVFDKSENLFFRNPRNKYSEPPLESKKMEDYKKIKEDPARKIMYRADRDLESSKNTRKNTSNIIQSEKSFFKGENFYEDILDQEKNEIKKPSNIADQFKYHQKRYPLDNSIEFKSSEVKHAFNIKDTDASKSMKEFEESDWNVAKDSSQFLNKGQLRNNLLEIHPENKLEITAKNDDKQINSNSYNSKFPQNLNIWKLRNEELDSSIETDTASKNENDEDMKDYFMDESESFTNIKDYYDEIEQDIIESERDNYNHHILPQNLWKNTKDEELDDLNFMSEKLEEIEQSRLYPEENRNYFKNEQNENVILQDKVYTDADVDQASIINARNAYILPRYLNIVSDKKYSVTSNMQELSEAKNRTYDTTKKTDLRFFEDKATENKTYAPDLTFPKDIFNVNKYNPIDDTYDKLTARNKKEILTELDPDLLDDIENPPIETTEPTLK